MAFAASVAFEAVRVVLTERLLAGEGAEPRMNAAEVLVHIGPLTGLMLAAGSVVMEGPHLVRQVRRGAPCVEERRSLEAAAWQDL